MFRFMDILVWALVIFTFINSLVSAEVETCSGMVPMVYRNDKISILDYGGVGDGRTLNTKAFREAIFRIEHLKRRGGTLLYIPSGVYLTGSFNLTSHMTLYLAKGAVIKATKDTSSWPLIAPLPSYGRGRERPGERYMSFIHGDGLQDVIITAMDSISNWEQNILANELNQGMEFAKKLKSDLSSTTSLSPETRDMLMQKISSSYDNALFILNWNESSSGQQAQKATTSRSESPISEDYRDLDAGLRNQHNQGDVSKKRKAFPTWKDQVRICSGNSIDGPTYDGCSWRKYGQKDILGAKYPRSYYRCTYRSTQDCWATKQVQRSDEDPSLLEITYNGKHTCNQANYSVLPPASPENEEQKCKNHQHNHTQQPPSDMLSNFRANLQVNTEEFDTKDVLNPFSFPSTFGCLTSGISFTAPVNDNMSGGYPPFISPATSGSSYLSVSPLKMNNVGQVQEAEDDDIISATTNSPSPFANLDFSIDQVNFDPSFPFHTSDLF